VKDLDEIIDEYEEMQKRRKEKKEYIVNNEEEKVRLNMHKVTPRMMMKLDTERFKHLINQYIKHKTVETRYMDTKMYAKAKPIMRGTKLCKVERQKNMKYVKFKFVPVIDKPESFEELETIEELLLKNKLISVV
jgi:hypothetical protein